MAKNIVKVFGLDPLLPLLVCSGLTLYYPWLSALWVVGFWIVFFRRQ